MDRKRLRLRIVDAGDGWYVIDNNGGISRYDTKKAAEDHCLWGEYQDAMAAKRAAQPDKAAE